MKLYFYNQAGEKEQYYCTECGNESFVPYAEYQGGIAYFCKHCGETTSWFRVKDIIEEPEQTEDKK